ncbi:MAG: Ig-like domain-containing protein [Verrucomicrobia bacterium]|jgi:hypothetical protein|nr:Ig-like domain-containing protein [Verrucomicrobiota bacterium]
MRTRAQCVLTAALLVPGLLSAAPNQVLGWNNLGMHCMDSDYSVFSVLPPYNTIEAQLIVNGHLVTVSNGYSVTYEAVADAQGSINRTAVGKGNFSEYDQVLYGADLAPEVGLLGWAMPGTNNVPQSMVFQRTNQPVPGVFTPVNWFHAEGIPITPYDDAGTKNPYPLMRLIARSGSTPIATNDIVLPVSDEMDCRACHASGTQAAARPAAGWTWSANPERDYRLNILRKHDDARFQQMPATYTQILATNGFNPLGLYQTVVGNGQPILCAKCHLSEALPGTGVPGVAPLTEAVHAFHANVMDPVLNMTLDDSDHRAACYRCHPGSATRCLRGAMGAAIAADGSLEMQCQSCHGSMSQVGSTNRVGWIMEPNCQGCHTGTATANSGQIRYTSVFTDTNYTPRVVTNPTFATQPNTPAAGLSLYRFSAGHGGLQCSACHGSTHAIFPTIHANDNRRNIALQGHAGTTVECTACHVSVPRTFVGGPHGMHPVGTTPFSVKTDGQEQWFHGFAKEDGGVGLAVCQTCHGADYRGTVLSRAQADRIIGSRRYWRGKTVGCYDCHNGPGGEGATPNTPPTVANLITNTSSGASVALTLPASDANGDPLTLRIVSQPHHGSVGLSNSVATYYPEQGYVGPDQFTFAARDGFTDSNLATGTVSVAQGPFAISAVALVPPDYPDGWPVPFGVAATPSNLLGTVSHQWSFGDGSPASTQAHASHAYASPGSYGWSVVSAVSDGLSTASATNSGTIVIGAPLNVVLQRAGADAAISYPTTSAQAVLEETGALTPPPLWSASTNAVVIAAGRWTTSVAPAGQTRFYRLRHVQ